MAFTHTVTGATDRSSIVRGDVALVSGTWLSVATATGTVAVGGGTVLAGGVSVGSAVTTSGTAQMVIYNMNTGGNSSQTYGSIGVTNIDVNESVGGDWWAIIRQTL